MSRKYRQPGYQDSPGEGTQRERRPPPRNDLTREEKIQRRSMRVATTREANEVIRCHVCGRNVQNFGTIASGHRLPELQRPAALLPHLPSLRFGRPLAVSRRHRGSRGRQDEGQRLPALRPPRRPRLHRPSQRPLRRSTPAATPATRRTSSRTCSNVRGQVLAWYMTLCSCQDRCAFSCTMPRLDPYHSPMILIRRRPSNSP